MGNTSVRMSEKYVKVRDERNRQKSDRIPAYFKNWPCTCFAAFRLHAGFYHGPDRPCRLIFPWAFSWYRWKYPQGDFQLAWGRIPFLFWNPAKPRSWLLRQIPWNCFFGRLLLPEVAKRRRIRSIPFGEWRILFVDEAWKFAILVPYSHSINRESSVKKASPGNACSSHVCRLWSGFRLFR